MVRELREELSDAPRRIHADDFSGVLGSDSQVQPSAYHKSPNTAIYLDVRFFRGSRFDTCNPARGTRRDA